MKEGRIVKSIAARLVLFSVLAVLLISLNASMNDSITGEFVYDLYHTAELVRISEGNTVTFGDLAGLKSGAGFEKVTGYSEIIPAVSNKFDVYGDGIKAVLIDADYSSVYKNLILAGDFPDARAVAEGEACAIISDRLAVRLFKSIDVIGNQINISGRKYTVTGVYKSRDSILWSLCGDGFDRLFIPYTSVDGYKEKAVDVITLLEKPGQTAADLKKSFDAVTGVKLASYNVTEHSVTGIVVRQYLDLLIFTMGVLGILATMVFGFKYFAHTLGYLKKKTDSYYIAGILKADTKTILKSLFIFFICCAGVIILIKSIQFKFFIADAFIPDDNIFDVQFYFKVLVNELGDLNAHVDNIYSILVYYYINILHLGLLCDLLIVIFTFIALMLYKLLLLLGTSSLHLIKLGVLITFAGVTAGVIATYLIGAGISLPFKAWIVLLYYPIAVYYLFNIQNTLH